MMKRLPCGKEIKESSSNCCFNNGQGADGMYGCTFQGGKYHSDCSFANLASTGKCPLPKVEEETIKEANYKHVRYSTMETGVIEELDGKDMVVEGADGPRTILFESLSLMNKINELIKAHNAKQPCKCSDVKLLLKAAIIKAEDIKQTLNLKDAMESSNYSGLIADIVDLINLLSTVEKK